MAPDELHSAITAVHRRFAGELDQLLDVHVPEQTDRRFRTFFDAAHQDGGVPQWAMSFHHAREALTSAYYHRRRIEHIERSALRVLRDALGTEDHPLPEANMSIGARTLTYDYWAYLGAIRRLFDYVAQGFARRVANKPAKLSELRAVVRKASTCELADRIDALVDATFSDFKDLFDRRNILSHVETVPAGSFRIVFQPGQRAEFALVEGSEELPGPSVGLDEPRLGAVLDAQLAQIEDRLFDFVAELP